MRVIIRRLVGVLDDKYRPRCRPLLLTLIPRLCSSLTTHPRHGIYFHTPEQEAAAKAVMAKVQEKCSRPIVTECMPAAVYWPAEVRAFLHFFFWSMDDV